MTKNSTSIHEDFTHVMLHFRSKSSNWVKIQINITSKMKGIKETLNAVYMYMLIN